MGKKNLGQFHRAKGLNVRYGNIYCLRGGGDAELSISDSATATKIRSVSNFPVDDEYYGDAVTPLIVDSLAIVPDSYHINFYNAFTGDFLYALGYGTYCGVTIVNNIIYYTERQVFIDLPGGGGVIM